MTKRIIRYERQVFIITWVRQLMSLIGSGLTNFALGFWVYQRTRSVTQFALVSLFTKLPGIVLSPITGALVDRWERRATKFLIVVKSKAMSGDKPLRVYAFFMSVTIHAYSYPILKLIYLLL